MGGGGCRRLNTTPSPSYFRFEHGSQNDQNQEEIMSIAYIGHSQAKPDEIDTYRNFLLSVVRPAVQSSEGCHSYQMLQSQDDPTRFIGIEVWDSVEAHRAAVKNIPPERINEFMQLVAAPPSGGYYHLVT
jgi:quinol monooxygenase YgiN